MDFEALKKPFPREDVEWRVQSSGKKGEKIWALVLAYITNRAIMDRLDEVCGPENWKNQFAPGPLGGVICGISVKIGDEWITKWDGADETDIEKIKGGLSGAMKRAGVQWGIGRYLYDLDSTWAVISPEGKFSAKTKEGTWFKWDAPELPSWALPAKSLLDTAKAEFAKITNWVHLKNHWQKHLPEYEKDPQFIEITQAMERRKEEIEQAELGKDPASTTGSTYITESEIKDLKSLAEDVKADIPAFLGWLKVESFDKIPKGMLWKAIKGLEKKAAEALNKSAA